MLHEERYGVKVAEAAPPLNIIPSGTNYDDLDRVKNRAPSIDPRRKRGEEERYGATAPPLSMAMGALSPPRGALHSGRRSAPIHHHLHHHWRIEFQ